MLETNKIHNYNCLEGLKLLDENSVDCCITSPPYWGLRDYGVDGQLGLEKTPEEYVSNMVVIFKEVKRVLKPQGTLWLNLGDTYYNYRGAHDHATKQTISSNTAHVINSDYGSRNSKLDNLKGKDLVGIPWMVAFALRSDGWYLRQDIIWHKPNPMPESVTDRCTKSHEYIFLMSKSQKYYFNHESIQEEAVTNIPNNQGDRGSQGYAKASGVSGSAQRSNSGGYGYSGHKSSCTPGQSPQGKALKRMDGIKDDVYEKRNKRDVWTINTKPYLEAHFATFPEKLIVDMIKAGCLKDGIVLDPFMGAGTTAVVARKLNRNFIGFELNKDYITIADKRLYEELGMYL